MDLLFQWLDKFAHNFVIQLLMDHSAWVDWFALLFVIIGIAYGIQNGFMTELAEIFQILVVIFLTFFLYDPTLHLMLKWKRFVPVSTDLIEAFTFFAVGISIWILLAIIYKFIKKFFHMQVAKELRVIGGAILGSVHLFIIFSFICQALILMPFSDVKKPFEKGHSFTGIYLKDLAPKIYESILNPSHLLYSKID